MRKAVIAILSICALAGILFCISVEARRISLKVDTKALQGQKTISVPTAPDSTAVLRDAQASAAVRFFGYDKPFSASKESVFVTNTLPADTIISISAIIEYSTQSGKLLHKREVQFNQEVAPEQSTRLQFDTWDATHTFYYFRTPPARKQNLTPYQVKILPLEVTLKQ